ncbi:MAG: hemolysin family protein [Bacteroidota bacterium]
MSVATILLVALLALAFSFFFSGMEIAFLASSRLKIELRTRQGSRAAEILSGFKKRIAHILVTILIGNNVMLVIFTQQVDLLFKPILDQQLGISPVDDYLLYTGILSIIGTLIVLIFAEYIPKALFRAAADQIVYPSAYLLAIFYYLLWIPVWVINQLTKIIMWVLFRTPFTQEVIELTRQDLDLYLQEVLNSNNEEVSLGELDTEMLEAALELRETKVREFMIPRMDIVATSMETPVDELMDLFIESKHSRIIVFEENLDDVKGFVHSSTLFLRPESIQEVIQEVLIVPESMPANILLGDLNDHQRPLAIVVDEFGGTAGMITMEDLLEEVFGEIEDEHYEPEVEEELMVVKNRDGSLLLGARLEIEELNERFQLALPEGDYTTLGGLVIHQAQEIPATGDAIEVNDCKITVVKAEENRIVTVNLRQLNP